MNDEPVEKKEVTPEQLQEYEEKAQKLIALARIYVRKKGPYFMRLLYSLVPTSMPGLGTIAVTDTLLFIYDPIRLVDDPEFSELDADKLPHKLAGGLVHECQHILRGMHRIEALAKTNPDIANIAADLAINGEIRTAGWALPKWACWPETYNLPGNKTMEWYFAELMKDPEKNKEKASGELAGGGCGSVAGNPGKGEEEAKEKKAGKERSKAQIQNAVRGTIQDAEKHFSQRGDKPGWLKEAAEGFKESRRPERNWHRELAHVVRRVTGAIKSGGADFSMARPSRRSLLNPMFIRPGLVEQEIEIAIYWDTSISMGKKELNKARQITCEVLRQMGVDTIWMAQGDTQVTMAWQRVRLKDIGELECAGRGGTSFIPAFESLEKLKPKPDLAMMVSDGDGPAPKKPPRRLPVVWVLVPCAWRKRPTDWGHYVICSNDHDTVDEFG